MSAASDQLVCCFQWGTKTGAWLMVPPYTVNGAKLEAQEWYDALFLCYGIAPPYFHPNYDG